MLSVLISNHYAMNSFASWQVTLLSRKSGNNFGFMLLFVKLCPINDIFEFTCVHESLNEIILVVSMFILNKIN